MAENFDDIRSYRDKEVKNTLHRLLQEKEVRALLPMLIPDFQKDGMEEKILKIESVHDFQHVVMYPIFMKFILPTFSDLTCSGIEKLDPKKAHLFISNHRDIVLDSTILNYFLHVHGFQTAEIAIGDNLLKDDWIKDLVRLNKSFIVKRGLDNVEMLKASRKLSKYIRNTIQKRRESIWIAQRAGRAKDGNDETHRGLINMLYLSSDNGIIDHFADLNIVPVSISYEYDPCDIRKTRELYTDMIGGSYVKSMHEDVESMQIGIKEAKGKGHIHFGAPLRDNILAIPPNEKKAQMITAICHEIDKEIQSNYHTWPSNHLANLMLTGNEPEEEVIGNDEKEAFSKRLDNVQEILQGDSGMIRDIFLRMYQQPLANKRKWVGNSAFVP